MVGPVRLQFDGARKLPGGLLKIAALQPDIAQAAENPGVAGTQPGGAFQPFDGLGLLPQFMQHHPQQEKKLRVRDAGLDQLAAQRLRFRVPPGIVCGKGLFQTLFHFNRLHHGSLGPGPTVVSFLWTGSARGLWWRRN